jgi:hypothetical protein
VHLPKLHALRRVTPVFETRSNATLSVQSLHRRVFARSGAIFTDTDRSAATHWLPPGRYLLSLADHLRLQPRMAAATGLTALPSALHVLDHLEQMHPAGRTFWYLGVLGVEPDKLLKTGLDACDATGRLGSARWAVRDAQLSAAFRCMPQVTPDARAKVRKKSLQPIPLEAQASQRRSP